MIVILKKKIDVRIRPENIQEIQFLITAGILSRVLKT